MIVVFRRRSFLLSSFGYIRIVYTCVRVVHTYIHTYTHTYIHTHIHNRKQGAVANIARSGPEHW